MKHHFTLNRAAKRARRKLGFQTRAREIMAFVLQLKDEGVIDKRHVNEVTGEITVLVGVFRKIAERIKAFREECGRVQSVGQNAGSYVRALKVQYKIGLGEARGLLEEARSLFLHCHRHVGDFSPAEGKIQAAYDAADAEVIRERLIGRLWAIACKVSAKDEASTFIQRSRLSTARSARDGFENAVRILDERQKDTGSRDTDLVSTALEDIDLDSDSAILVAKLKSRLSSSESGNNGNGRRPKPKRKQTGHFLGEERKPVSASDSCGNVLSRSVAEHDPSIDWGARKRQGAVKLSPRGNVVGGLKKDPKRQRA